MIDLEQSVAEVQSWDLHVGLLFPTVDRARSKSSLVIPGEVENTPPPPYSQVAFQPGPNWPFHPPCPQCFPPIAFPPNCFYSHPPYGQVKNLTKKRVGGVSRY